MTAPPIPLAHNRPHALAHLYYPWFDWLRGVLAITVMLYHEGLMPWSHSGNFAVQVFFALSGWLIGGLLLQTPRAELKRFYFNRAVRIWVPYCLALALLLSASLLREPVTAKWLEIVFYKLTFVYNWFGTSQLAAHGLEMPLQGTGNHFWSVNAEEQFYLLAPLLLVLASARIGRSLFIWLALALLAWWFKTYASIVIGVTAAVAASKSPDLFESVWARVLMVVVALACVAGFAADLDYDLVAPALSICIVLLLVIKGTRTTLGSIVGGMSYPLYLNHWIGIFTAHAALKPFGLRDSAQAHAMSFVVNVTLAVGLYWYVDRRLLANRHRIYSPERAKLATRTAYAMVVVGMISGLVLTLRPAG